jgi:DNA primase small subunit
MWVFSGRRGIHCWVSDYEARKLKNPARSSIIEYMNFITGNAKSNSKVKDNVVFNRFSGKTHPAVNRAIIICKSNFNSIVL